MSVGKGLLSHCSKWDKGTPWYLRPQQLGPPDCSSSTLPAWCKSSPPIVVTVVMVVVIVAVMTTADVAALTSPMSQPLASHLKSPPFSRALPCCPRVTPNGGYFEFLYPIPVCVVGKLLLPPQQAMLWTPAASPTIQLIPDTIYLEMVSDPTG